jgi:O-antigen/teichoic acid export membrane protein
MTVIQQGLDFIVNYFYGVRLNAATGISKQVNGPVYAFAQSAAQSISPQMYKAYGADNPVRLSQLSFLSSKVSFLLFGLFALPILLETNYILKIWLKNVPEYAAVFTQLFIIYTLIKQLSLGNYTAVAATGNIKKYHLFEGIVIISTFPISWILLKNGFSPWITYLTLVIAEVIATFIRIYYSHKIAKVNYKSYLKTVLFPSVCTFLTAFFIAFFIRSLMEVSFVRLAIVSLSSMMFFLTFAFGMVVSAEERGKIKNLFLKIKNNV